MDFIYNGVNNIPTANEKQSNSASIDKITDKITTYLKFQSIFSKWCSNFIFLYI